MASRSGPLCMTAVLSISKASTQHQPSMRCPRLPPTVLADSGEVFSSLPSALPTFDQWLNYSAGVNINKTIAVRGGRCFRWVQTVVARQSCSGIRMPGL